MLNERERGTREFVLRELQERERGTREFEKK
jgi:hypothetical protein